MSPALPFPLRPIETVDVDSFDLWQLLRVRRTPLLLRGLAADFPAVKRWSIPFLRSHFAGRELPVSWSRERVFPGQREGALPQQEGGVATSLQYQLLPAERVFSEIDDVTNCYYLNSFPLAKEPALLEDLPWEPARSDDFGKLLWVSSHGHVTPTHFDANDILFLQVQGRKRFVLFPPSAFERLYVHAVDHPQARYSQLLDLASADLARFPEASKLEGFEVVVEPGCVLFLPSFWWHAVYTEGTSISVSSLLNREAIPRLDELMGYWSALHEMLRRALPDELSPAMRAYVLRLLLFPPEFLR